MSQDRKENEKTLSATPETSLPDEAESIADPAADADEQFVQSEPESVPEDQSLLDEDPGADLTAGDPAAPETETTVSISPVEDKAESSQAEAQASGAEDADPDLADETTATSETETTADDDSASDDTQEDTSSALEKVDAAFAEERRRTAQDTPQDAGGEEMTFTAHLEELRMRLTRSLVGIFIGFLACYAFAEDLFSLLMAPLTSLLLPAGGSLIYTGLPEAFFTHLKVAAIAGFFLASPYVFYQLWMFVAPGLYESERKWIIPIALCSAVCFVVGALFGYYIVFPFGFQFFLSYTSELIRPLPSVKEYFSFASGLLFAFGFIFELPLVILFLSVLGVVTHQTLRKYRKYAILSSFIVGAILTPPDVISQLLMAGPLCVLYEIGIIVAMIFGKKSKKTASEEDTTTEPKVKA